MAGKDKKKAPAAHPSYQEMVTAAIKELKNRKGSTRQAIVKHVVANYKIEKKVNVHVKMAMVRLISKKTIEPTKFGGQGLSGRFKLKNEPAQEKKPKSSAKKAKKSPAKKQAKKAVKKSTTQKKSPKKKTARKPKSPAKKSSKAKVTKEQPKSTQKKQKVTKSAAKKARSPKKAAAKKKSKK